MWGQTKLRRSTTSEECREYFSPSRRKYCTNPIQEAQRLGSMALRQLTALARRVLELVEPITRGPAAPPRASPMIMASLMRNTSPSALADQFLGPWARYPTWTDTSLEAGNSSQNAQQRIPFANAVLHRYPAPSQHVPIQVPHG